MAVLAHGSETLPADIARRADAMVERRRAREPAAHILGRREFWGLEFEVTAAVLDPRPDSETLIEAALAQIADRAAPLRIVDLGTGTGCLLLALLSALANARGLGVDVSPQAVELARRNAARLGLSGRASFSISDWGAGVEPGAEIVLANPPYIRTGEIEGLQPEVALWEPRLALDGGSDGLGSYRRLIPAIAGLLAPRRDLPRSKSGRDQAAPVGRLAADCGLSVERTLPDLGGRDRCLILRRPGSQSKKQLEKNGPPSRVAA